MKQLAVRLFPKGSVLESGARNHHSTVGGGQELLLQQKSTWEPLAAYSVPLGSLPVLEMLTST